MSANLMIRGCYTLLSFSLFLPLSLSPSLPPSLPDAMTPIAACGHSVLQLTVHPIRQLAAPFINGQGKRSTSEHDARRMASVFSLSRSLSLPPSLPPSLPLSLALSLAPSLPLPLPLPLPDMLSGPRRSDAEQPRPARPLGIF